jgi:3-deoxy-D-manno-octulosonate 8-phosphate phosphatase (KDO 8-P phosphatase)
MAKNVNSKAEKIKLIAMDVDGVLTGGEIIVLSSGEEVKIWSVKDGFAFHYAKRNNTGLKFAWITGRNSKQVSDRAKESKIDFLYQGCMSKLIAVNEIARKMNISLNQIAYIGDDLVDIPVLKRAGLSFCPADAPLEVKKAAYVISKTKGGKGILKEVVDIVLKSQGLWNKAVGEYLI